MLTSGMIARSTGINKQTLRYYERIGLLCPEERSDSGYRLYSNEDVDRIRFIQNAKDLGFRLSEIKELLDLRFDAQTTDCDAVRNKAEIKRAEVLRKIDSLSRMNEVLGVLITSCAKRRPVEGCPILAALEGTQFDGKLV